jgi:SAM-dependent methyltransferase
MHFIKQPRSSQGLIVTLNKMGYMLEQPEEYNQAFIEFASSIHQPCLEIGAAYGVSTIPALMKGAYMTSNDLSKEHLDILKIKVPKSDLTRLTLKPGRFPEELTFEDQSFAAILSFRMLNFIRPELLQESFNTIFKWLKNGGKFFILVTTPYVGSYRDYLPIYENKKREKDSWPGLIHDIKTYLPQRAKNLPAFINLLDKSDLVGLLENAGFRIEKIGYSIFEGLHPTDKVDGRELAGAIAIKPL